MRKRDELADPNSCLNRAREDEWVFVLLERDIASAATVLFWIEERIRLGKNKRDDAQIVEAKQWAETALIERGSSRRGSDA